MSATHAHELDAAAQSGQSRNHAVSPVLWMGLLLAILLGVFTLIRRHDAPAPALPASAPATPTAVSPATEVATPETAPAPLQRRPAVVRDRQARPLAGNPAPAYPPAALRAGIEGSVVASLQVDAQGKVTDASIVSHDGQRSRDLDRAVLDTLRGWRFEPALRDGRAVATVVRVPVDFRTGR